MTTNILGVEHHSITGLVLAQGETRTYRAVDNRSQRPVILKVTGAEGLGVQESGASESSDAGLSGPGLGHLRHEYDCSRA